MKPEAAALKQFQDLRPPVTQLPDSKGESLGSGRWEWVPEGLGWAGQLDMVLKVQLSRACTWHTSPTIDGAKK